MQDRAVDCRKEIADLVDHLHGSEDHVELQSVPSPVENVKMLSSIF